jgi:hypothetical protein
MPASPISPKNFIVIASKSTKSTVGSITVEIIAALYSQNSYDVANLKTKTVITKIVMCSNINCGAHFVFFWVMSESSVVFEMSGLTFTDWSDLFLLMFFLVSTEKERRQ